MSKMAVVSEYVVHRTVPRRVLTIKGGKKCLGMTIHCDQDAVETVPCGKLFLTPFCLISNGKDWPLNECQPLILEGRKRRTGREKYRASALVRRGKFRRSVKP